MKKLRPLAWLPPLPVVAPAVLSGLLLALAFPPASLGILSFGALVPVIVALNRRRYPARAFFKAGYLFGIAFFLAHLWWIVGLVPASSITAPWLMTPALIVLVLYLAVYPALFFLLMETLGRGSPVAALLLGPALWLLGEFVRSSGEFGFSWGAIGYSLTGYPVLIQGAAVVGLFGVGAFVVLVNVALSHGILARDTRERALLLLLAAAVPAVVVLHGSMAIREFSNRPPGDRVRVAIAQPNVDLALKWDPAFTDSTFGLIRRMARQAAERRADLVVFPETAAPVYLRRSSFYKNAIVDLADELQLPIYIGFLDGRYDGPGNSLNIYNSSGIFYPDGRVAQYDKIHLLPFGEMIPFAWKFPVLKRINFGQANFHPGPVREPLPSDIGAVGPLICFESIFPLPSRRAVRDGAEVLVNITNDGWFGPTPGPYQHNAMAIFRAVENRRYLVRSSNTGISMVVDPAGRVVASLGLYEEGILVESIRPLRDKTIYTRIGDAPIVLGCVLLIVIGTVVGWGSGNTSPRRRAA